MDLSLASPTESTSPHLPASAWPSLVGHGDSIYARTMIPIVIDTNVFVAVLHSAGGASRAVLRGALATTGDVRQALAILDPLGAQYTQPNT